MKKAFLLLISLFLTESILLFSTSLVREHGIEIKQFKIIGEALPDSIVKLVIELESSVTDSISFYYQFDGHMSLASGTYLEYNEFNSRAMVNSSSTFRDTLELKVWEPGTSMISLLSSTQNVFENKTKNEYNFINVTSSSATFKVVDQDVIQHENKIIIKENPMGSIRQYFNISGKVLYNDINQQNLLNSNRF